MIQLIGAGGHGKVVIDAWLAGGGRLADLRLRDGRSGMAGSTVLGLVVDHPEIVDDLSGLQVHVAIGDNRTRRQLTEAALAVGASLCTIVHPSAVVSRFAQIGDGCWIGPCAIIGPDVTIEGGVIVGPGAVVDHDCRVASHAFIGANATLAGGVSVGEMVRIGPGATVPTGLTLGTRAVIAPGVNVLHDLQPDEPWPAAPCSDAPTTAGTHHP